jgi:hypothetical protein
MNFTLIVTMALTLCLASVSPLMLDDPRLQPIADTTQDLEKEILGLEEIGRQKALNGDNNWDDLMADGAYMIVYDGSAMTYQKGQRSPSFPMKSFNLSEMIARVYGDVAVVTGLAEVEGETADKKPFSFKMRYMNVWKKSGASWKIVVSERTTVTPPRQK